MREVARAMEEQLRKDQQELKTREQRRKAKDAKRIRGIVHGNNKNKRMSHLGKLMHHDEKELLSVWEGWHWDNNKGWWFDLELCAKARGEEVE